MYPDVGPCSFSKRLLTGAQNLTNAWYEVGLNDLNTTQKLKMTAREYNNEGKD